MKRHPLILLHHAGGSSRVVFEQLISALPESVQPVPLDLPGRGRRWREEPVTTAEEAVDDLLVQIIQAGVTGDFAIFGHSMGAYLGLALAARFERLAGDGRCDTLFASANAGPFRAEPLFAGDPLLADAGEVEGVAVRFGGIARQVLEHEQLRERAVKLLRADFAVCDDFVATLGHTVTESDLVVCCGTDDVYTEDQVRAWMLSSTAETAVHWLPGGHFYLGEHTSALARLIGERLGSAAPAAGAVGAQTAGDRCGS